MSLEITVRGSAEERVPPELAVLSLVVAVEGTDREEVRARAAAAHAPLVAALTGLAEGGSLERWSSDDVRVGSHRPWEGAGRAEVPLHTARLTTEAVFTDLAALDAFVDTWAGHADVELDGVTWDVGHGTRHTCEHAVRRAAVEDAVARAQAYADAVRAGRVTAVRIADPGLLDGHEAQPFALAAKRSSGDDGSLALAPTDVVIRAEVHARFVAG